jgi:hypothetical protein
MGGMIAKDRLLFDPADLAESDNIGSYVRAGSDGDLVSSTLVGGKEGLDVNIINASVDVNITNASVVVTASDLDIRDLTHVSDSIKIGDGTDFLAVNADGSINVNLTDDGVADDAPDAGNPLKVGSRAVSGALTAVSASNDRADLLSDMYRRVWINDSPNISVASAAVSVPAASAVALPAAALAGRRRIMIQNLGSNDVYVGPTGVTSSSGLRVAKGSTLALEVGENIALFARASSGAANDVRVFELA